MQETNIPLAMLVVFGSAKLLAELFERMKLPAIVGEILAGVLIGPGLLGWCQPNDVLKALADLGVLFLLFEVGMEVKPSELMRVGPVATLVATLGVLAPLGMGTALMAFYGAPTVECLFVGAAMVATSVGITAQVLSSRGLLQERASQIILAAAVIDDVLGLIVLAVVSSLARAHVRVAELAATAALAIGFTLVIARWGSRTMQVFGPWVVKRLKAGEARFNVSLVLLFALALAASYTGVAAIVGAFLAGLALSETAGTRVRDLTHGVTELLVPFFLAGIGMQMDLSVFLQRPILSLSLAVFAAAVVSKMIGCGLGAVRLGRRDMFRIGAGMVPRGEVGMVVAQIGVGMGVIPKPIYAVVVFMAVGTTMIAPALLNFAFIPEVRSVSEPDEQEVTPA